MQEVKEMRVLSLGLEDTLEEEIATCSSILAWRISWTEKPGQLQSHCPLDCKGENLFFSKEQVSSISTEAKFHPGLLPSPTVLLDPPRISVFAHSFNPNCACWGSRPCAEGYTGKGTAQDPCCHGGSILAGSDKDSR